MKTDYQFRSCFVTSTVASSTNTSTGARMSPETTLQHETVPSEA